MKYNTGGRGNTPIINDRNMGKIGTMSQSNLVTTHGIFNKNEIDEFYVCGADAAGCVKSTTYNMAKTGYLVHVISDCVTSYDLKKVDEMLKYYEEKGCEVKRLDEYITA